MVFCGRSPFSCSRLEPLFTKLKVKLGLPTNASNAHISQIFLLPSFVALVLKRTFKAF